MEPVDDGHVEVEQHDVGVRPRDERCDLGARGGAPYQLEVDGVIKDLGDCLVDNRVIVGNDDTLRIHLRLLFGGRKPRVRASEAQGQATRI